jgi:hypothetical protein
MTPIQIQMIGLLKALGAENAPRACEIGAAVGLTTGEAERELGPLLMAKIVACKVVASQARWFIVTPSV